MNNIDILERLEYFEPDDLVECVMYRDCVEGVKTLISENKELKEENEKLVLGKFREVANKNDYIKENYIPKSKVEEILNKYKYTEIEDSEKIIQFYKELQSLLGKE